MKKNVLTIFVLFFCFSAQSQIWFETGLRGSFGLSFLSNKHINDDRTYDHILSTCNGVGARLGINFGENHGLTIDGVLSSQSQEFNYELDSIQIKYVNEVRWKNLDIYLLYRFNSGRAFFELGPMFSRVRDIDQVDDNVPALVTEYDLTEQYVDSYVSGVFGFGSYLTGSRTFTLSLNFRLHYSFDDFIAEQGQSIQIDGEETSFPALVRQNTYPDYQKTSPAFATLSLEATFGIGEFAQTACSERLRFFGAR